MSQLTRYLAFVDACPEMFANLGQGEFTILLQEDAIYEAEAVVTQRLAKKNLPVEWAKVGIAYEDQYLLILRDAVQFPNGQLGTYIRIVDRPSSTPGVVILPMYQERIVLLRHFRHATRNWHLEFPRGFGEPNMSGLENAQRELFEELEAEASHLIAMGQMHVNTGITSECVELYFASLSNLGKVDTNEGIEQILVIKPEVFAQMIRDNQITDSFTIAAFTRAQLNHLIRL